MFLGTYEPKLDDKARLILPSKFRDDLAEGIVLTRGQDHCVYGFTTGEFARMYEELRRSPLSSKQGRDYQRVMLSGAQDQVPDKQGRIVLPSALRQYAGLKRDLAVIGVGSRIEIWDSETWNAYLRTSEDTFAATDEEVIPGLL